MVGSVSSQSTINTNYTSSSSGSSHSKLSASQQETISNVLSQFDSDNLSASDAQSIVSAFKEAGIEPSKSLENAMKAEGFDAKEVGELAGVQQGGRGGGGMPPPPPPPNEEEESNSISALLDSLLNLDEDEEDENSTTTLTSGSSFDEVMEYTSRILNLNESSKTEVMDMLEKFSSDESDYTSEEKSNILKNSLGSILSDNQNYNRVSFYA